MPFGKYDLVDIALGIPTICLNLRKIDFIGGDICPAFRQSMNNRLIADRATVAEGKLLDRTTRLVVLIWQENIVSVNHLASCVRARTETVDKAKT
ncbi:hypothetical protein A6070_05555 [Syntrophotalea acetylenica]|nr:hypothetical protein A6070_05555 [Syntrophotalea acetylenica]